MWVMKIHGTAFEMFALPKYLKKCDFETHDIVFTIKESEAMQFEDFRSVLEFWKRPSESVPTRRDGKPNRPLTTYSAEPVEVKT